jgi:hypothetical protein
MLLFGVTSFAQDSTRHKMKHHKEAQGDNLRKNEEEKELQGWTRVSAKNIPGNLRSTLNNGQYSGWENGNVYVNENDTMYQLRVGGNNPQVHYFDVKANEIKKPD